MSLERALGAKSSRVPSGSVAFEACRRAMRINGRSVYIASAFLIRVRPFRVRVRCFC